MINKERETKMIKKNLKIKNHHPVDLKGDLNREADLGTEKHVNDREVDPEAERGLDLGQNLQEEGNLIVVNPDPGVDDQEVDLVLEE